MSHLERSSPSLFPSGPAVLQLFPLSPLSNLGLANSGLGPLLTQRLVSPLQFPRSERAPVHSRASPSPRQCHGACQASSPVSGHVPGTELPMPREDREHFCGKLPSSPRILFLSSDKAASEMPLTLCSAVASLLSNYSPPLKQNGAIPGISSVLVFVSHTEAIQADG